MRIKIGDTYHIEGIGTLSFTKCIDGLVHLFHGQPRSFPAKAHCGYVLHEPDQATVPGSDDDVCETCNNHFKSITRN